MKIRNQEMLDALREFVDGYEVGATVRNQKWAAGFDQGWASGHEEGEQLVIDKIREILPSEKVTGYTEGRPSMGAEFKPSDTWVDDKGAHEIHKFANGWGLSIINEVHTLGVLAEPLGKTALLRAVPEELSHYFIWDGTGSWKGRAEAAAILAAVKSYYEDDSGDDSEEDDE